MALEFFNHIENNIKEVKHVGSVNEIKHFLANMEDKTAQDDITVDLGLGNLGDQIQNISNLRSKIENEMQTDKEIMMENEG